MIRLIRWGLTAVGAYTVFYFLREWYTGFDDET